LVSYPTSYRFFWESPTGSKPILGLGKLLEFSANGLDRAARLIGALDRVHLDTVENETSEVVPFACRPRFFGGFRFRSDPRSTEPWQNIPAACFHLPRFQITWHNRNVLCTINYLEHADPSSTRDHRRKLLDYFNDPGLNSNRDPYRNEIISDERTPTDKRWVRYIRRFKANDSENPLRKIVPAQHRELQLARPVPPNRLAHHLQSQEGTFKFLYQPKPDRIFVGASPERLVSLKGSWVETESLAGTVAAGSDEQTARELADTLQSSSKDRREQEHVSDYLENVLSPLVDTVRAVPRTVRSLSTVQHLVTKLQGHLKSDCHVLDLVDRLHPTPAVAGRPTGRALREIERLETFDRGFYAAPVGWFDLQGNGEFSVAIRSALVRGTRAHTFAGAGILSESNPKDELDELELKFRSINKILLGPSES
jgi:menaquinone-specific isochorismate synthase